MGSAPSSITIDNGASYIGVLKYTGSALAINVANGTLQNNSANVFHASSLTVGSAGSLIVAIDPVNLTSTQYDVAGAATFASGSKIGVTLLSAPTGVESFTVVRANSLTVADSDQALFSSVPYLFSATSHADTTAGTVTVSIGAKTPAQLGLNKAESSAFAALYAALPQDAGIQSAIVSAADRKSFTAAYDQLLPDSAGDVFQTASAMSRAVGEATADRSSSAGGEAKTAGFWGGEYLVGIDQGRSDSTAYRSVGGGLVGGLDFGNGLGTTFSVASANVTRPNDPGDTQTSVSTVEGGFYVAPQLGALHLDARLGAGYLSVSNRRQFVAPVVAGDLSSLTTITRLAKSQWSGYDLSGRLGAGLEFQVGKRGFIEPLIHADFFHLHENAYTEKGGGDGFDMNVQARDSTQTSVTGSVVSGMRFGSAFVFSPQVEVGWDDIIQGGPGKTTAQLAYGGPGFIVPANNIGGAGVLHLGLKGDGEFMHFAVEGGGEFRSNYTEADLKAVFRMSY
jgi:hypothetical protein